MKFSIFLFGACADDSGDDYYRFALRAAEMADNLGLHAIWVPERHFHPFGGYFPNPSVTAAAMAARTKSIGIRAGSVNLPLHDPLRVAEEWAVVDQISGGRVGVSVASGWNDRDFVLQPESFESRREVMAERLDTVRRLWRGECIERKLPKGESTPIEVFPKPRHGDVPIWLTAAGTQKTFENAGRWGCNVLTHLLGQPLTAVTEKIDAYRSTSVTEGVATLMMHTFISEPKAELWDKVKSSLERYIVTSMNLLGSAQSPWSSGAMRHRDDEEDDGRQARKDLNEQEAQVARHAARRYFNQSGLFGSLDEAGVKVGEVAAAGIDEIACLIDFGIPLDDALVGIENIAALSESWNRRPVVPPQCMESAVRSSTPVDVRSLPLPEQIVVNTWRETLKVEAISWDDDFFSLGGISLEALRVMRILADADVCSGPQNLVFAKPVLRDFLAAALAGPETDVDSLARELEELSPEQIEALLAKDDGR